MLKRVLKKLVGSSADYRDFLLHYIEPGAVGAEIGVWKGAFARQVLGTGRISKYYVIDPYEFQPQFPTRMYGGKVAKSQADMDAMYQSVVDQLAAFPGEKVYLRGYSDRVVGDIPDGTLDFVYIDGNHYYDGVMSDLENYVPKVKVGGYVILDDWLWRDDDGRQAVKLATVKYLTRAKENLRVVEIHNSQIVLLKCGEVA